ncbi:PulJ/GspJ family protein [Duganella lactea]|nr:prepilin-type N-terminal cleavage/methylation domain-containing protein [Duganella lactea]
MMARARGGFTLIELLLAISILAMMAVLGWRGLDSIVRSRGALTDEMDQSRGLQLAFAQMQSDCAHLADSALLSNRAYLQAEDNRITLVRMVMNDNQPTRLQVVSYRVNADGVLTRRESNATRDLTQLDNLWQAALSDADTSGSVALQSRVQGMGMRLWVTGAATQPQVPVAASAGNWQPAAGVGTSGVANRVTGLEVSLSLQGQTVPMVKAFLLGAL